MTQPGSRAAVHLPRSACVSGGPHNPADKDLSGNAITLTGTTGGFNSPFRIEYLGVQPPVDPTYPHWFVLLGTIYGGPATGDDIVVQKLQYQEGN